MNPPLRVQGTALWEGSGGAVAGVGTPCRPTLLPALCEGRRSSREYICGWKKFCWAFPEVEATFVLCVRRIDLLPQRDGPSECGCGDAARAKAGAFGLCEAGATGASQEQGHALYRHGTSGASLVALG